MSTGFLYSYYMQTLQHPNIIALHEVIPRSPGLLLVFDFMPYDLRHAIIIVKTNINDFRLLKIG